MTFQMFLLHHPRVNNNNNTLFVLKRMTFFFFLICFEKNESFAFWQNFNFGFPRDMSKTKIKGYFDVFDITLI